jgi:hypothetical protein
MEVEINSASASRNDTFVATVVKPLILNGVEMLPAGIEVEGRVTEVSRAAAGGRDGKLNIRFERLKFSDGRTRPIEGAIVGEVKAEPKGTFNTLAILGGLGAGTLIGSASKSTSGILAGAGIGTGIGVGIAFLRKGREARIRGGQEFEMELKNEVIMPAKDY